MSLPKISIITVSYNQGEFIRQNIESVLAQGYPDFEHIVVDGGSTDSTVEILKSYPHLKWTSEPDRGQSDALNKGFQRAQGEYIGWLNSDDWYAPNIFFDVAQGLSKHPIVHGAAEQTDRAGKTTEFVHNTSRSFYDLWRYWIPYAWVAQPSIFFRRSLLEEVARPDGTFIDEDLFFTMDSDLWMRLTARYPLKQRIDRTLSYFRIYDENKTGARPLATQRECSRIFRRHANAGMPIEQEMSFVIPLNAPSEDLKRTIISLVNQHHVNFDILLADYSTDRPSRKVVHEFSLDLSETVGHISTRYIKSPSPSPLAAFNEAVKKATAPLVAFLSPGDTVNPEYSHHLSRVFSRDAIGLVIPDHNLPAIAESMYPQADTLNPAGIITMPYFSPGFASRRLALLELDTFGEETNPVIALKSLLMRLVFRGWGVHICPEMKFIRGKASLQKEQEFISQHALPILALIIQQLKADLSSDPFADVRARVRDPRVLFHALNQDPAQILASCSPEWKKLLDQ